VVGTSPVLSPARSRAYIERTLADPRIGRLGAATTFEVPASANSSEFPLTNNTAARKGVRLTRIPETRARLGNSAQTVYVTAQIWVARA